MKKNIVITGSSRGIGFGLAKAFLDLDCKVVISGSSEKSTKDALSELKNQYSRDAITGIPCNVTDPTRVENLWDKAQEWLGNIDIWINNAGISHPYAAAYEIEPDIYKEVIDTNLLGLIYGTITAYNRMVKQGYGAIYNLEGFGSDGKTQKGMIAYGTQVAYRKKSLFALSPCTLQEEKYCVIPNMHIR